MKDIAIEESLRKLVIDLLEENCPVWVQSKGRSMHPLIREGDYLKIMPLKAGKLEKGDIVAFLNKSGNEIIAHRLIKEKGALFKTAGDNYIFSNDPLLTGCDILGKVVAIKRYDRVRLIDCGFIKYYGKFIAHLRCFAYPLLFICLSLKKLFFEPAVFLKKPLLQIRQLID